MNSFMYTVLNADIPVIYIGVSDHMFVKCVIRHSVYRAILQDINERMVVSTLMFVKCVIRHSVDRAILQDINEHIVVSALMFVKCVVGHSVNRAV